MISPTKLCSATGGTPITACQTSLLTGSTFTLFFRLENDCLMIGFVPVVVLIASFSPNVGFEGES